MTTDTLTPARVVNFVTGRPSTPSPESLGRAVAGSWIDALREALRFARTINHEVV
jgi:hypothetical protein